MASDAPPGLPCPLCFVLGHLRRLFRATNIPVVIEEGEENLHDDIHRGSSVTTDEGDFLDPGNGLDEEETVRNLIGVPDNPTNSSRWLVDVSMRPLISATSRNPTAGEILRSNSTSGPFSRPCTENRNHASQRYRAAVSPLHCSGCRRDHPSFLFSAKQRQEEPDTRICIGREGHIRLCEHRTFGWDEFVHTSSTTNADTSITCNHPDHLGASKKPVGLRARLGMSPHRAVTGTETPSEVQATFEHTNNYASWVSEIGLDKEAHVKIPAYKLRSQPGSLLLASDLRQVLETQRGQSPCPWFPEEGPRQIDAMACFKPFRCICVVDENERERIQQECIAGPFNWDPSANECPQVDYHREDRWSGDGTAYVHTEFSGCSEHDGCVILSHSRSIRRRMSTAQALEPCDSQWYQALDPSSHNLVDDIEFKNVTWCEDARCRNFYRFRDHASVGTSTS